MSISPSTRLAWCLFVFALVVPTTTDAIPRFAARTGATCGQCHINPTGGGQRTRYGRSVFEKQYLSIPWDNGVDVGADTELGFGDAEYSAAIGADLRAAFLRAEPDEETPLNPGLNSFFLMQADLYVSAQMNDYVTLSIDIGQSRIEAYGMLHSPDRKYWLKAGQFLMPYGLRYPNHRVFVREQTGFNPAGDYRGLDVGLEAGARYGPFNFIAAVGNGAASGFDDNDSKAVYGKIEYLTGGDDLKLRLGLNAARNFAGRLIITFDDGAPSLAEDSRVFTRQAGAYITSSLGRFTYIGEVDVIENTEYATDRETFQETTEESVGYATFQELSFLPIQGVDIQATFDFWDPDVDLTTGTVKRVGAGFELYPVPMLEWKVLYRHTFAEHSPFDGMTELITYLHFFM